MAEETSIPQSGPAGPMPQKKPVGLASPPPILQKPPKRQISILVLALILGILVLVMGVSIWWVFFKGPTSSEPKPPVGPYFGPESKLLIDPELIQSAQEAGLDFERKYKALEEEFSQQRLDELGQNLENLYARYQEDIKDGKIDDPELRKIQENFQSLSPQDKAKAQELGTKLQELSQKFNQVFTPE